MKNRRHSYFIFALVTILLLAACSSGSGGTPASNADAGDSRDAERTGSKEYYRGVSDDTIKIGLLVDLTGPYKVAGADMQAGVKAYFDYINENGGINGRKLKLYVEDNGANPVTTAAAANKLVFNDEVFALAGVHGAAAFSTIYQFIDENKVPSFSLGLSSANNYPHRPMVFNVGVPYSLQGARGIDYFVKELNLEKPKIGVLYQDDDFGMDFLNGARAEARALGVEIIAEEAFPRGAEDISAQVANLQRKGAEQVFLGGIYTTAGQFMREANKIGYKPLVVGPNPSRGEPFFDIAGDAGEGYKLVDYFAPLNDPELAEIKEIVEKYSGKPLANNMMYGLVNAIAMVEILKACGEDITPENFVSQAEKMSNIDMKGIMPNASFAPDKHFGTTEARILEADVAEKDYKQVADLNSPEVTDLSEIFK